MNICLCHRALSGRKKDIITDLRLKPQACITLPLCGTLNRYEYLFMPPRPFRAQKRYYYRPAVKTTGCITLPLCGILNRYEYLFFFIRHLRPDTGYLRQT